MEKRPKVLFQQLEDYRQETLKAIDGEWVHFGTKPADWDTQPPKLAVLVRTIFHEGMHLASLHTIRRCLGK